MSYREPSIAALFAEVKQLHRRLEHQESKLHGVLGQPKSLRSKQQASNNNVKYNSPRTNRKAKKNGYMQPTKARIAAIPPELSPKSTKSPRMKLARNVPDNFPRRGIPKQLDMSKLNQMLEDDNMDMSILLEVKDLLTISLVQSEAHLNDLDTMLANADDARPPTTYRQSVQRLLSDRQDKPVIIFRSPVERKVALFARKNIEYAHDEPSPSAPSPTSKSEFSPLRQQPGVLSHVLKAAREDHDHDLDTNIRMLIERQATYFNERESSLLTLQNQQQPTVIVEERYDDQFDAFSSSLLSPSATTMVPPSHASSSSTVAVASHRKAACHKQEHEEEEVEEEKHMDAFRSTLTSLRSRLDLLLVDEDSADSSTKNLPNLTVNINQGSNGSSKPHKKKLRRKKRSTNSNTITNRNSNGSPVSLSDNSSIQSSNSSSTSGSGRMKVILPKMNSKSLAAREVILERAEIR